MPAGAAGTMSIHLINPAAAPTASPHFKNATHAWATSSDSSH
jgi:hypothetical protein